MSLLALSWTPSVAAAAGKAADEAAPACKAALLMDAASGEVLSETNAHESLPPASMVKMMVAYTVFKRLSEGSIRLDDMVTASGAASKIGGSQVYLKLHEQFSVRELLEALLVQSANDAAYALSEHIAGDPAGFVEMMNVEAQNIGMKESAFYSPHGLPPGKNQKADLMSAWDLALLGRALITEFPQSLEYTGKSEAGFRNASFQMRNHNHLVRTFTGCDGIKTGYYTEAGFGVTATAQKNGMRMIAVVMGCETSRGRDAEAARLLSSGFARYRSVKVVDKGALADRAVPVSSGALREVVPVAADSMSVLVRLGEEKKIERKWNLCQGLKAPVAKDTACGEISFSLNGRDLGKVNMVVPQEVAPLSLRGRIWRLIRG